MVNIFTHKKLEIGYNGEQIVEVTLTGEDRKPLAPGATLEFSYEVLNFKIQI